MITIFPFIFQKSIRNIFRNSLVFLFIFIMNVFIIDWLCLLVFRLSICRRRTSKLRSHFVFFFHSSFPFPFNLFFFSIPFYFILFPFNSWCTLNFLGNLILIIVLIIFLDFLFWFCIFLSFIIQILFNFSFLWGTVFCFLFGIVISILLLILILNFFICFFLAIFFLFLLISFFLFIFTFLILF